MRNDIAVRPGVDGLERRELLSLAASPYSGLAIRGHFAAGASTTVTFAAKGYGSVEVTPALVAPGRVEVAIPAFFDPATGEPVAVRATVRVAQNGSTVRTPPRSIRIAALPQTGLDAGNVAGAATYQADAVAATAGSRFLGIGANLPATNPSRQAINLAGAAVGSQIMEDLQSIRDAIPLIQSGLVAAATGATPALALGTFNGQPAGLGRGDLATLDRILAAGIRTTTGRALTGAGLVGGLGTLVHGTDASGPDAIIGRAGQVVAILGTATGPAVVSPGAQVSGLALGALTAIVAATEAEGQILQGAFTPGSDLGPDDLAAIDRVLEMPALGEIEKGFVPTTDAGRALLAGVRVAEDLAGRIDPNLAGSDAAKFAAFLRSTPLHGA